jgi:peptidyl-prolyl cis-trans isomerase A (cyclophilin A)
MKTVIAILMICVSSLALSAATVSVRIETELGVITVELYPDRAPLSCANFLRYVNAGLYDNTTFFRTVTMANQPSNRVKIEVIQGGDVPESKEFSPIALERTSQTGLHHLDGSLSMARAEPDTATCSFSICVGDQPELDFGGKRNPDGQGFAAFGRVTSGMEVVRAIHERPCREQTLAPAIKILSIRRL